MAFHHRTDGATPAGPRAEEVGRSVLDAAFFVHDVVGPGLREPAYRVFLAAELEERGVGVQQEAYRAVTWRGRRVDLACKLDLLVENVVVVEVKAVETIHPAHIKQLATYLRVTGSPLGFVINFNEGSLGRGIRRVINSRDSLPVVGDLGTLRSGERRETGEGRETVPDLAGPGAAGESLPETK